MKDYATIAKQYTMDVVAGRIPNCQWVIKACQRHLDDLTKVEDQEYPYRFSPKRAAKVCKFAEMLPITGRSARVGNTLKLQPWQVFILSCVFGWVEKATGFRRFTTALVFVPRKNGKSFLSAVVGLYCLLMDGEQQAEVYCAATTESQALKVWSPAAQMIRRSALKTIGVKVSKDAITVPSTESKMTTVIGQPLDGDNPSCVLADEAHQWANDRVIEAMQTGMGERPQPLMWVTTTAGLHLDSPAKLFQDELQDVLNKIKVNDRLFGVVYGLDADDDYLTDAAIYKANPNAGISVRVEFIRQQQAESKSSPRKASSVKTKHFNIWCSSASEWIQATQWNACADATMKLEDFAGEPCIASFDLAFTTDLTAYVLMFKRDVDGKDHYYLFSWFYLPSVKVEDPTNTHYRVWAANGHLISTPGAVNTHEGLQEQILNDAERFEVREVAHDPHRAFKLVADLIDRGLTCVKVEQGWRGMSEPMKGLQALVEDGCLHHSDNPVMNWCISNTIAVAIKGDNIIPDKATNDKKIDGTDAAIMALARAQFLQLTPPALAGIEIW